ncbi:MAG TPA: peptidylprolyl isomerase [Polyangiaceae bacterium]|jgi:peptidylprolyl isomerase
MRRLLFASIAILASACSNNSSQPGDAGGSDSALPDSAPTDAAAEAAPYLPAGYTQMSFLSDTPIHSFKGDGGGAPQQVIDSSHDYVGVLETDAGRIVMHLLSQVAPITVNSFVFLVLNHFYDGIAFHRVIDQFVAQGGDPNTISGPRNTWGNGGPGYSFGLEVNAAYNYDDAGVVGMARTQDPNSNGSQFFIELQGCDCSNLNQQYTIWADVIEGLDVLPLIARSDDAGNAPATPTRIQSAYIGMK